MPALPPVPNVLRIDFHFTIGADLAAKCRVFHGYAPPPAPTISQLNTMASSIAASVATNLTPLMTPDRALTSIVITDLTSPTSAVGLWTGSHPGTVSGGVLPASICALMKREVLRRYRGGHSRVYWPFGGDISLTDDQHWSSAAIAAFTAGNNQVATDTASAITAWGNDNGAKTVSYYEGFTTHTGTTGRVRNVSTPRLVPLVDGVVAEVFVAGLASQRKRLLRLA